MANKLIPIALVTAACVEPHHEQTVAPKAADLKTPDTFDDAFARVLGDRATGFSSMRDGAGVPSTAEARVWTTSVVIPPFVSAKSCRVVRYDHNAEKVCDYVFACGAKSTIANVAVAQVFLDELITTKVPADWRRETSTVGETTIWSWGPSRADRTIQLRRTASGQTKSELLLMIWSRNHELGS